MSKHVYMFFSEDAEKAPFTIYDTVSDRLFAATRLSNNKTLNNGEIALTPLQKSEAPFPFPLKDLVFISNEDGKTNVLEQIRKRHLSSSQRKRVMTMASKASKLGQREEKKGISSAPSRPIKTQKARYVLGF